MRAPRAVAAGLLVCGLGLGSAACSSNNSHGDSGAVTELDKLGPDVAKLRLEVQQLREEVRALQEEIAAQSPSTSDTTSTTTVG